MLVGSAKEAPKTVVSNLPAAAAAAAGARPRAGVCAARPLRSGPSAKGTVKGRQLQESSGDALPPAWARSSCTSSAGWTTPAWQAFPLKNLLHPNPQPPAPQLVPPLFERDLKARSRMVGAPRGGSAAAARSRRASSAPAPAVGPIPKHRNGRGAARSGPVGAAAHTVTLPQIPHKYPARDLQPPRSSPPMTTNLPSPRCAGCSTTTSGRWGPGGEGRWGGGWGEVGRLGSAGAGGAKWWGGRGRPRGHAAAPEVTRATAFDCV
jgi:hypothetical protein